MRPFAAGPNRPGTNFIEIGVDQHNLAWIEQSVQDMRRANADLLVLSLHWGSNLRTTPTQRFRSFAHAAIERGIDVIHGHSAHVAQAVECYKSGLILYGTGNSIDDSWKVPFYPTTTSFAFVLDIENCQLIRLKMIPVQLRGGSLGLATGEAFDALGKRMRSLCMDVNTSVIDTPAGLEIILS
jgi:poly-gamma-glutamate synthesis protein (capsule biosynthesis protein)